MANPLDKPALLGLAVHNARLAINKARQMADDRPESSWHIIPPEVQKYCLFRVDSAGKVLAVASAPTAADMAPFITAKNRSALAKKYPDCVGFLLHDEGKKGAKAIEVLHVPQAAKRKGKARR